MKRRHLCVGAAVATAACAIAPAASAFCGFYVSSGDAKLFNHATNVVMMRDGVRTVLAMQNNYEGPPEDFAMVTPVPVVLKEENVHTLSRDVFDRVDQLTAPRLVEYWEQDPCADRTPSESSSGYGFTFSDDPLAAGGYGPGGVTVEARFAVGEYEVVILSASDSTGLEAWLHDNGYKIPAGAEGLLRPYVAMGMKFFVAKVDVSKVHTEGGHAMLSPLRFHYDTDTFSLPIRLGLVNSAGTQDLIVNIFALGQRYEVANYANVAIPTNLDVAPATRAQFGAFYAALFDRTIQQDPRAVVTEYAWPASSCDPCPTPALTPDELYSLGADVLPSAGQPDDGRPIVVTRLHMRYGKDALGDDLVFRPAPPIEGGREDAPPGGKVTQGARPAPSNDFQARYVIRHPWSGDVKCAKPARGVWGGPPSGVSADDGPHLMAASKVGFAPRGGVALEAFLVGAQPAGSPLSNADPAVRSPFVAPRSGGCAGCATEEGGAGAAFGPLGSLVALALGVARGRARRRR